MKIEPRIAAWHDELTHIRRDIHAHPELGFEEERTSAIVAAKLREYGCEVTTGIARTGVVGTIRVGNSPNSIGLRADMDCLPMQETNTFAHASKFKGRMHGCGHDGHTTMLLGAAKYLAETRKFQGTVHLIFQPAEEGQGGGRVMVEEGLFDKFPCDAVFAMHNWPVLEAGKFQIRPGPMLAGGMRFDITVKGQGTHGAKPETGIDPVITAAHIATAAQSIVSRTISPHDPVVLSVTQIHAGDAYNVIPETAVLRGTIRCFTEEAREKVRATFTRIAREMAAAFGAEVAVDIKDGYPPLVNDETEAGFLADVATEIVGADNVERNGPRIMGSEDFSYMLQRVPGAFVMLGQGGGTHGSGHTSCEVHNPGYDFNDAVLPLGATLFARLVERKLGSETAA
ncbi:M20 aminoacylase family protein [Stella sp.]|uniref:M20 aminoacylase family protein n=1 Tax=Stella sp. TaxID=2912054 RepID=UPI0035B0ECD3